MKFFISFLLLFLSFNLLGQCNCVYSDGIIFFDEFGKTTFFDSISIEENDFTRCHISDNTIYVIELSPNFNSTSISLLNFLNKKGELKIVDFYTYNSSNKIFNNYSAIKLCDNSLIISFTAKNGETIIFQKSLVEIDKKGYRYFFNRVNTALKPYLDDYGKTEKEYLKWLFDNN